MDQDDRGVRKELGEAWGRKTIFRIYCIENQFSLIEKKKMSCGSAFMFLYFLTTQTMSTTFYVPATVPFLTCWARS